MTSAGGLRPPTDRRRRGFRFGGGSGIVGGSAQDTAPVARAHRHLVVPIMHSFEQHEGL
ncbi:hypothetical protein FRIGORI9N_160009 [Frigoribacterium sp. 9N]|nr:hypothetical protein FRIGORI9N_160009 [Frigoribacterium sp. 9N]